jgi:hypothetical protein
MASAIVSEKYDEIAATTDGVFDLGALLLLSALERAELDDVHAHGELCLEERCWFGGALVMPPHYYPSFAAALSHVDYLFAMTPRAFTADHGPILLVLSEVAR